MNLLNRLLVVILLIAISTTTAYSQNDSSHVDFVSYWSIGDYYEFTITKVKKRWKNDTIIKNEESSYIASFNVIDSSATSYTIKWVYENDLGNTYNFSEEVLKTLEKYEFTEVIYTTTEVGAFIEVVNWKEISEQVSSMFDDLKIAFAAGDHGKLKQLDKVFSPLKKAYSSKQGIETLLLKELQYIHFPMGLSYQVKDTLKYEELLPNLTGGNPIKGNTLLYVESVDHESSFCTLKQQMELDEDDTKKMLTKLLKKMGMDSKKSKKAFKNAKYKIEDHNEYQFYNNPGIPHKIIANRRSIINFGESDNRGLEQLTVELRYNDPINDSLNCAKFKVGKFIEKDEGRGCTFIERKGSKQIEYNDTSQTKVELDIYWLDECTYSLKFSKILENPLDYKLPENSMILTVEIYDTKEDSYFQRVSSNLSSDIVEEEIFIAE
jgi:hypothetical protein